MRGSDNISFPSKMEMRLYTLGILRKRRRREIEILSMRHELIADAMVGYKILYSIWLKRFFIGTSIVVFIAIAAIYSSRQPASLISQRAVASLESKEESLFVIRKASKEQKSAVRTKLKLAGPEKMVGQTLEKERKENFFNYQPDSVFILKEREIELNETVSKHYGDAGRKIRFVEGYMLSDHDYKVYHSLDVPRLGGVPAEYENRKTRKDAHIKSEVHVIDLEDEVDKAIVSYSEEKYDAAISRLELLSKEFPNDVNLNFYLGMSYYQQGNYALSLQYLGKAVTQENDLFDQEQDYYIAMCYWRNGQEILAKEYFEIIAHSNSFYKKKAAGYLK